MKEQRCNHVALRILSICLFFIFGFSFSYAAVDVSQEINYQGKLSNSSGVSVADGPVDFIFTLYNSASATSSLYVETWNSGNRFSSTISTGIATSGTSIIYAASASDTYLQAGDALYDNTVKDEVVIEGFSTSSHTITISPTGKTWAHV